MAFSWCCWQLSTACRRLSLAFVVLAVDTTVGPCEVAAKAGLPAFHSNSSIGSELPLLWSLLVFVPSTILVIL
jgi:hypothetical protein